MKKPPLTAERLRYLLDYDPATGIFVWKHPTVTSMKPGTRAGSARERGYWRIVIDGRQHLAATLAWMYMHGEKPSRVLRFKNGNTGDCRIGNLTYGEFHYSTPEGRRAYEKDYRQRDPRRGKNADLKKTFGITLAQFQEMLVEQKGVCAICGQPETLIRRGKVQSLSVDHNHETDAVRELLCTACNSMVGYSRERPELLRAAAAYLERHAPIELPNNIVPLARKEPV
jgi:recombination endonuclease VII/HNH endonuclease